MPFDKNGSTPARRSLPRELLPRLARFPGQPATRREPMVECGGIRLGDIRLFGFGARVAGLRLDEVQDSGRSRTDDSMEVFLKRFRNMMQETIWPVCLIVTATPEMRRMFNLDPAYTRRMRPIEIKPITFAHPHPNLRSARIHGGSRLGWP